MMSIGKIIYVYKYINMANKYVYNNMKKINYGKYKIIDITVVA